MGSSGMTTEGGSGGCGGGGRTGSEALMTVTGNGSNARSGEERERDADNASTGGAGSRWKTSSQLRHMVACSGSAPADASKRSAARWSSRSIKAARIPSSAKGADEETPRVVGESGIAPVRTPATMRTAGSARQATPMRATLASVKTPTVKPLESGRQRWPVGAEGAVDALRSRLIGAATTYTLGLPPTHAAPTM